MALEWGTFGHGGVVYPLTPATTNSLVQDADPALYQATAFLAAALRIHLDARFTAESAKVRLNLASCVRETTTIDPTGSLQSTQLLFPLFALYRKNETRAEHTVVWRKDLSEWEFAYVLPPLQPRQQEALHAILRSVTRVIDHALTQGYEPGYLSGTKIWQSTQILSARLKSAEYKAYDAADPAGDFYRAVVGTIEVIERDMPVVGGFVPFDGADIVVSQQGSDASILTDVADVTTYQAPTLTAVTPNSGTKAGGTAIVLTGTNFRAPMTLSIGTIQVPVVVTSLTSATATTPAHSAYPTFMANVVMTGFDGQSVTLPAGFTFTSP